LIAVKFIVRLQFVWGCKSFAGVATNAWNRYWCYTYAIYFPIDLEDLYRFNYFTSYDISTTVNGQRNWYRFVNFIKPPFSSRFIMLIMLRNRYKLLCCLFQYFVSFISRVFTSRCRNFCLYCNALTPKWPPSWIINLKTSGRRFQVCNAQKRCADGGTAPLI
jgi:hypothetical protein